MIAQSAGGAVKYTASLQRSTLPMSVLDMTLNDLMTRFQYAGALGNVEYPFIAINPKCTLALTGSVQSLGRIEPCTYANDPGDQGSILGRVIPKT